MTTSCARTRIPNACRTSSAVRRPIRPNPTIPIVLPVSSLSDERRSKNRRRLPLTRANRLSCSAGHGETKERGKDVLRARVSVPYTGTLETGIRRRAAAAMSTTLYPVANTEINCKRASEASVSADKGVLLVNTMSPSAARSAIRSAGACADARSTDPSRSISVQGLSPGFNV